MDLKNLKKEEILNFDRRFQDVLYIVEANSFERQMLWEQYNEKHGDKGDWVNDNSGFSLTLGHLDSMPICVSFWFAEILDVTVMFYNCDSMVVDHRMIEAFLEKGFSKIQKTDPMNFHNFYSAVEDLAPIARARKFDKEFKLSKNKGSFMV